jgi:hypothetical protein
MFVIVSGPLLRKMIACFDLRVTAAVLLLYVTLDVLSDMEEMLNKDADGFRRDHVPGLPRFA